MCAHPSRPKRDRRQPPRPIRSAKLRKPAGIIPHTRGRPRAGTVAEHHSAHTETHEDAGTVAESSPQCGRTLPCRPPNRGRVVSVRRNRNPGTSTTHERKRVCRWEAHQSLAPAGQRDAPRRIKRAHPGGEAAATSSPKAVLAGELGLPSYKPNDRATSRTVVWTGACCPASAPATRGRVFDGKKSSDNTQERACTCTRAATRHGQLAELHHASCEDHRGLGSTPTQQASRKHRARARARGAT